MRDELIRQAELIPENILSTPVTIVGAGAVGSFVCLMLAKMGFDDITVFDYDSVSIENMNSQFYRFSDIGRPKVLALKDLIKDFTNVEIKYMNMKWTTDSFCHDGVIISAVDSMVSRRAIYESVRGRQVEALFDPRMGAEEASLIVCKPFNLKDCERYTKTLYLDEQAIQERCTAKATIYTANMLGGLICKTIRDVLTGVDYKWNCKWSIKEDDFVAFKNSGFIPLSEAL